MAALENKLLNICTPIRPVNGPVSDKAFASGNVAVCQGILTVSSELSSSDSLKLLSAGWDGRHFDERKKEMSTISKRATKRGASPQANATRATIEAANERVATEVARRKRVVRNFPAAPFEEPLAFAKQIFDFAVADQRDV